MAGDGGSQAPMPYQPTGQAQADQSYQSLTGTAAGYAGALPSQVLPQLQSLTNGVLNNPNAAGAQQTAGQVASIGSGQIAPMQFAGAQSLAGLAGLAPGLAQSVINTGFDPQGALYNRSWQQNTDQTNAINAMNGVAGSPYGAGLATQSNQNFNTDWQNAQLGRQLSALGGYGTAMGAGVQGYDAASNLGNTGLSTLLSSGTQPYNTSMAIANNGISALDALSRGTAGALAPSLGVDSALGSYMSLGQNATQIADSATAQNNQQQQAFWSGIASLFGGQDMGKLFGGGGQGGGAGAGNFITNLFSGGGGAAGSAGSAGGMAGAGDLMELAAFG